MENTLPITQAARLFVEQKLTDELTDDHRYHNLAHTLKVREAALELAKAENCTEQETEWIELAALFHDVGFSSTYEGHEAVSVQIAKGFLATNRYTEADTEEVLQLIRATYPPKQPTTLLERIIKDADLSGLGSKNHPQRLSALRHEWSVFLHQQYEEEEWRVLNYQFLSRHRYFTEAARQAYGDQWKANRKLLKPNKKKKKKKKAPATGPIASSKSAQMMFKTALRNHIDLASLADNKANIMLSVNALIITILIPLAASYISEGRMYLLAPMGILLLTCLSSMVSATLATRPIRTEGQTSSEAIREGRSNLFFFGNFYRMNYADYELGMKQVIAGDALLEGSIMRDLFFLGSSLGKKYQRLRLCYTIFMWGIILTVVAFGISYSWASNI